MLLNAPIVFVADVSNLNAIIDETPELEGLSLHDIMLATDGTTFNNAAQVSCFAVIPTEATVRAHRAEVSLGRIALDGQRETWEADVAGLHGAGPHTSPQGSWLDQREVAHKPFYRVGTVRQHTPP